MFNIMHFYQVIILEKFIQHTAKEESKNNKKNKTAKLPPTSGSKSHESKSKKETKSSGFLIRSNSKTSLHSNNQETMERPSSRSSFKEDRSNSRNNRQKITLKVNI